MDAQSFCRCRRGLIMVTALWATTAMAQSAAPAPDSPAPEASAGTRADPWQAEQDKRIGLGDELLKKGQPEAAIREAFDPVIQAYEARYAGDGKIYFSSRDSAETPMYLLGVAAEHDRGEGRGDAVALGPTWAQGYYGKAYALIELNRFDEAATALDRALELSPANSQFLTERGYVYRASREWDKMLASNQAALEHAQFTPESLREGVRARALRGAGYALIELDRLDEAERHFRDSLKIEPENQVALGELDYIKQLRKKKP
nr:tetratricopeptide repeat protein [Pseudoxanthomonas sp.]